MKFIAFFYFLRIKNDVHIHNQQFRKPPVLNFHQNRSWIKNHIFEHLRKNRFLNRVGWFLCIDVSTIGSARKFWSKPEGGLISNLAPKKICAWKTLFSKQYFLAKNASSSAIQSDNFLLRLFMNKIFFLNESQRVVLYFWCLKLRLKLYRIPLIIFQKKSPPNGGNGHSAIHKMDTQELNQFNPCIPLPPVFQVVYF